MFILLTIYYITYIEFKPFFKKAKSFIEHIMVIFKQNEKHIKKKMEQKAQHEKKKREVIETTNKQIKEIDEEKEKKIKEINNKYNSLLSQLDSIKDPDKLQEFLNTFINKY